MSDRLPAPLHLGEFLPYRLSVLTNKVSRALAAMYSRRFDLSVAEWRVMAVLGQEPEISADRVCARTEMDKVTVSRAVSRLLRRGYLRRALAPEDRRRSVLRLSRSGYGVYARIIPLAREYESRLLEVLDRRERVELGRLVEKLDQRAAALTAPR